MALDAARSGPVYGVLVSWHGYVDLRNQSVALDKSWPLQIFVGLRSQNLFEFRFVPCTVTDCALPQHRYGSAGFRGHRGWSRESIGIL